MWKKNSFYFLRQHFLVVVMQLLSSYICFTCFIRQREQASLFISRLGHYILEMTGHAVNVIQGYCRDFKHFNCFGSDSFFDLTSSVVTSFRSFASCPIFKSETNHNALDVDLYGALILSMENFLKALSELYQEYSRSNKNLHSEVILKDFDAPITLGNFPPVDTEVSRILDVELDVNDDSNDMDVLAVKRSMAPGMSSATIWKLRMISLISSFCLVLHEVTWEVLFELLEKECDSKVHRTFSNYLVLSCFLVIMGVLILYLFLFRYAKRFCTISVKTYCGRLLKKL